MVVVLAAVGGWLAAGGGTSESDIAAPAEAVDGEVEAAGPNADPGSEVEVEGAGPETDPGTEVDEGSDAPSEEPPPPPDAPIRYQDVVGTPRIAGDSLPPIPEGGADPAIGMIAPLLEGADFDGNPITVGAGPQVVSFVASWCPACDAELPEVVEWQEAGGPPEGVDLVLVSTNMDDSRQNWPPQEWLADAGYTGDVLVDDSNSGAFQAYGLRATPSWVVINGDGAVVFRASGMIDPEQFDGLGELAATG